jgi:PAS domain S-box-containing protein
VRALADDGRGGLWVGTRDGGLSVLRADRFTTFGPGQGLASLAVQALCVDREDDVWVATRRGLNRVRDGRIATLTALQGLPANYFYQVVEDGENLWLTYARGVARVAKAELHEVADGRRANVSPLLFGAESGMRSTSLTVAHQPTALRARDGRLWFATARGAIVIDPRASRRNSLAPPVHGEEVRVRQEVYPARDGLVLPPLESELAIAYTGLSFVAPEQVRFRFRLEGLDADWVEAGTRRTAYYTNLAPGWYRFRVTACNNDGVWSEAGASLDFRVLPRWHQRAALRALGLLALLVSTLGAHRLRTARLRARERELSARVEERTHALHELTHQLEARVGERTAELAAANAALTAEKERLAVTLRSIGDGVIATDVEARVILMNRVAEQLTGWKSDEATGRPLDEVLHTVDRTSRAPLRDVVRAVLERGVAGGSSSPCLLLARDGREILVADSAAPIRDPASRVIGAVFVFRDVTDREHMEEQLRNSQKLEALGVLAGGIAHDFNNLLSGIFGCVDVARARADDPAKAREALDRALSVMGKAKGLTQQLLTFARAGEPVRRPLLLGPLVSDAAGFVLSGSNVVADLRIAERLWPCEADEQQLNQVIDNLILNARQAMPTGGTLSIALTNARLRADEVGRLPAGPYVVLSIRDQGPGIPRELWPRIFEPFFTTKPRGTGLGLATVYSIVRKHGGHIDVGSELGVGTTFRAYLPALPDGVPGAQTAEVAMQAPAGAGRVLVMDDEPYVRETLQQGLESLGYEVLSAQDDEQALRLLREAQERGASIDVAILDLTIPGGQGGAAALQRLRALAPDLPGIASSGYSGEAVMARPAEYGFAAALRKPYTLAELGTVVAQAIEAGGRSRPEDTE